MKGQIILQIIFTLTTIIIGAKGRTGNTRAVRTQRGTETLQPKRKTFIYSLQKIVDGQKKFEHFMNSAQPIKFHKSARYN